MKALFANILDTTKKKKGIAAAGIILFFVILSGILAAHNSNNTKLLSPIEVVRANLTATKNNDMKALYATLIPGYKFTEYSGDRKLGVIQLEIIEVKEDKNPWYMERALGGETAKKNGWTEDNLTFVYALFDVQYDNTLVPETSGRTELVFTLVRLNANSPWLIKSWGHAEFK